MSEDWPDGLERGTLRVPRLHEDPGAGSLTLTYGRLAAREPLGLPPVVFLCGGPGDSAVKWWDHPPFRAVFEAASQGLDVILLDQRGCGRSEPFWRLGPASSHGFLTSREAAMEGLAAQAQALKESSPGFDPSVLTPVESARDLAVLAGALGVDQVQLWGYSYGTHLAMTALRVIPERVARAALCGFEGPNQTWKYPRTADHFLEKLGVSGLLKEALEKLEASPMEAGGASVRAFGLRWMTATWFGVGSQARRLRARLEGVLGGDPAELERGVKGFLKTLAKPAAFYLKDLASSASPDRLARIASEAPGTLLGEDLNFPFPMARAWWGQKELGPDHWADPDFSGPVFVLTGAMDGFTPTANAAEQGGRLPDLVHREIPGAAHDELLASPEHTAELTAFLSEPL